MQSTAIIHQCRPFTAHALLSQPSPENNINNNNNQAIQLTGVICVLKNKKHQNYREYWLYWYFQSLWLALLAQLLPASLKKLPLLVWNHFLKLSKSLWSDFGSCEEIFRQFLPFKLQRVWVLVTSTLVRHLCSSHPGQPGGLGLLAQPPVEVAKDWG